MIARFVAAAAVLVVGTAANAADIVGGGVDLPYCRTAGVSNLLMIDSDVRLTEEVVRLMDESTAVAASEEWIYSSRPVFVWASEAKVACGKAYGYLKSSYRDEDYLNKCECFHSRMVEYMH